MKIAQIIYNIAGGGGAENVVLDLSQQLIKRDNQIDLIALDKVVATSKRNKLTTNLTEMGMRFIFLNRKPGKFGLNSFLKLIRLINKEKYDIVHSHLLIPDIYVALAKILCRHKFVHIITVHSAFRYHQKYLLKSIFRPSVFVRCSPAIQKVNSIKEEHVIANAIDILKFSPTNNTPVQSLKDKLKIPQASKIIISVGNLRPEKNQKLGLKVMHHLIENYKINTVHYVICGHGPDFSNLKNKIKYYNISNNIHFLGLRHDIPQLLQQSDVFVNFSIYEGLPLAVIEAFASGIITVISPIEQHSVIGDNMPECYFPKDFSVESFTKVIYNILDKTKTPSKKDVYKQRKKYIEEYSLNYFTNKYLEIYKKSI